MIKIVTKEEYKRVTPNGISTYFDFEGISFTTGLATWNYFLHESLENKEKTVIYEITAREGFDVWDARDKIIKDKIELTSFHKVVNRVLDRGETI
jgi:hypothetical protein